MTIPGKDNHEAMAALERLYAKNVITLEEAQTAARHLSGDASIVFPPPRRPSPPEDGPAAETATPIPSDRPEG